MKIDFRLISIRVQNVFKEKSVEAWELYVSFFFYLNQFFLLSSFPFFGSFYEIL